MASGEAAFPDCATPSVSLYGGSTRRLSDLPIRAGSVPLRFSVRRFCCMRRPCPKCIFSEPLAPPIGRRYCRRVGQCEALVHAVAIALGGSPGRGSWRVRPAFRVRPFAKSCATSATTLSAPARVRSDARSVTLEAAWSGCCRIGAELWRWLKASGFGGSLRVKRQMYGRAMIDLRQARGMGPAGPKLHEI